MRVGILHGYTNKKKLKILHLNYLYCVYRIMSENETGRNITLNRRNITLNRNRSCAT